MPQDEIDDPALGLAEQVADACGYDMLNVALANDFLENVREIFENDDCLGTRVCELVLEFPRRIERVDIYDDKSGAKNAAQDYRVLQDVRQHDCDPLTACKAQRMLQVAGELHRQLVEVAVAQCRPHVRE